MEFQNYQNKIFYYQFFDKKPNDYHFFDDLEDL